MSALLLLLVNVTEMLFISFVIKLMEVVPRMVAMKMSSQTVRACVAVCPPMKMRDWNVKPDISLILHRSYRDERR